MRTVALGILLILSLDSEIAAQKWTKVTTPNFELYTTSKAGAGKRAVQHFERVRTFFIKAMLANPAETDPVIVIAFRSEKEFRPFAKGKNMAAFYLKDRERDFIVMRDAGDQDEQVAVHEYVHLLTARAGIDLPLWLNEGIAELYSNLQPAGKQVVVGNLIPGRFIQLQRSQWIPLEVLTSAGHDSPLYNEDKGAAVFYAQTWFLTHMLFLSDHYRPASQAFIELMTRGVTAEEGFHRVYGKSFDQVFDDLQTYQRIRQKAAVFDIKMEKSAETPEVEEADSLDALLMQAKILARIRKPEAADRLFAEYGQQRPDDWRLAEALAYRYWIAHDQASARQHFAKAVELGSDNPRMYFEYSALLQQAGSEESDTVPLLEKALQLKPDYKEAHYRLAFCRLRERAYEKALTHFLRVKTVKRDQAVSFYHGVALAYAGKGSREEARHFAERARKMAREPQEIAVVDELFRYLDAVGEREVAHRQWEQRQSQAAETSERRPTIRRRPREPEPEAPTLPRQPELVTIEGSLQSVDCLGERARLNVFADGKRVKLAIHDPTSIVIKSANGQPVELTCSQQKLMPVTIEFEAKEDPDLGTIGVVRTLEFE